MPIISIWQDPNGQCHITDHRRSERSMSLHPMESYPPTKVAWATSPMKQKHFHQKIPIQYHIQHSNSNTPVKTTKPNDTTTSNSSGIILRGGNHLPLHHYDKIACCRRRRQTLFLVDVSFRQTCDAMPWQPQRYEIVSSLLRFTCINIWSRIRVILGVIRYRTW